MHLSPECDCQIVGLAVPHTDSADTKCLASLEMSSVTQTKWAWFV